MEWKGEVTVCLHVWCSSACICSFREEEETRQEKKRKKAKERKKEKGRILNCDPDSFSKLHLNLSAIDLPVF